MGNYIESDKFFVLKENTIIEAYPNLDISIENVKNGIIIVDKFHSYETAKDHNPWKLSYFEFYNLKGEKESPKYNDWTLYNIEIFHKTGSYIDFVINVLDPKSQLRKIKKKVYKTTTKDINDNDIIVVIEAIKTILEFATFLSWSEYNNLEENNKLKSEISKLELKITEYENKKTD